MPPLEPIEKEELLNTISHAIGVLGAVIGMVLLISAQTDQRFLPIMSVVIYGLTLIGMLTVSTLYHASTDATWKRKLRILDHITIYFLIAGTYTPVALITLVQGNGWFIFSTVWGIALFGTFLKLFFTGRYEVLSLVLYLIMGWLILFDFQNLVDHTTARGIQLLLLGGVCYTVGIVFYAIRKIPYNHFIWHLFVLAGALSHWFFIYLDVL